MVKGAALSNSTSFKGFEVVVVEWVHEIVD